MSLITPPDGHVVTAEVTLERATVAAGGQLNPEDRTIVFSPEGEEITFHEAALTHSTNPDRASGGSMGTVAFGNNIKAVEDELFNLEEGVVSDPIKTPYGWSFFIVDKIIENEPGEYGAVRASIINRLKMRAMRQLGAEHSKRQPHPHQSS